MRLQDILLENLDNANQFKAIFLFGGPGSGKSTVRNVIFNKLGINKNDYVILDVDEPFQELDKDIASGGWIDLLYKQAGKVIRAKFNDAAENRSGLVIDSTGRNLKRVQDQKAILTTLGYQVIAIYVDTELNTALDRNEQRPRTVKPEPGEKAARASTVKQYHAEVQENLPKLKSMFDKNFITIRNNSDDERDLSIEKNKLRLNNFFRSRPSMSAINAWRQEQQQVKAFQAQAELTEDLDDVLSAAKSFVELIKEKCQPYLKEINGDIANYPLYRGIRKMIPSATKILHSEEPRSPVDTDPETHELFNKIISDAGLIADRSNAAFVTGEHRVAKIYGQPYLVFPIGDFHYTWSTEVSDWYTITKQELQELPNTIKGDDQSLKQSIKSKNEIMLHCPNGYYVYLYNSDRDLFYLEQFLIQSMRG